MIKSFLINKNFVLLWISQFLSQIALNTLNFLIILKVFDYTQSAIATSLVWLAYILPAIIIGPLAATLVDLVNKKRVLVIANLAQASIIFLYSLTQPSLVFLSYVVVLAYSFFNQFYNPAEIASLPVLVKKEFLPKANGLFLLTYQSALIIGYGLAGIIVQSFGFKLAFQLAGLWVFLAFLAVLKLPNLASETKPTSISEKKLTDFYTEVIKGINFIKTNHEILLAFTTIVTLQATLPIFVVNLPSITKDILGLNPYYSGIITTLPIGIGAAFGVAIISKVAKKHRKKTIVKHAFSALALAFWSLIIATPLLPLPYRLVSSAVFFALLGGSFIAIFISAQTFLQSNTPQKMLARVFGNSWFLTSIATVTPMLFSATITEILGVKTLILLMGLIILSVRVLYYNIIQKVEENISLINKA